MTMKSWKILHTFIEGMAHAPVDWYEEDYVAVRDGQKGHSGHLEIESQFAIVKKAIENPDFVNQDKGYKNRKCYYAASGSIDFPNQFMKVVIEHTWYGKIKVVTAYFTENFSNSEKNIWNKK